MTTPASSGTPASSPEDLAALRQRLLDLPVSHLTHHAIDTMILPLVAEYAAAQVEAATRDADLRDRWLRERLEDAYCGALGAHTGSDPASLPPILGAAEIRSILDDSPDVATMETDTSAPMPLLAPDRVRSIVIDVVDRYDWANGRADHPVMHSEHQFDGRCGICRGDGQQIGHAVAFTCADYAETFPPEIVDILPPGPTLSRLASLVAEIVVFYEWAPRDAAFDRHQSAAHFRHQYDGRCAVCLGDASRLADAVAVAYDALPTTPSTTDPTT